jgi:hypothetical protein
MATKRMIVGTELGTWSKDDLVLAMLNEMSDEDIEEFIKDNGLEG